MPSFSVDSALDLLTNFSASFPGLLSLLEAICLVGGTALAILGLFKVRDGASPQSSPGTLYSGWVSFIVGVLLVYAPQFIRDLAKTLWMNSECVPGGIKFMDYLTDCSGLAAQHEWFKPVVLFIQVYGFYSFVRGLFLLNRAGKAGGGVNAEEISVKAVTHVAFGLACIYIVDFMKVLSQTFGFEMLNLFT